MYNRLLIVDDEQGIRESLVDFFTLQGYYAISAENGISALKKMSSQKIDLIVSDIVMPVMNGVELLKQVKIEYPMVQVIMITGYVTLDNALACLRRGAEACVFKPFENMKELLQAVNTAKMKLENWDNKLKMLLAMKYDMEDRNDL